MNQFDIEKDTAKYSKEARLVSNCFALSVVFTMGFFAVLMICLLTEKDFADIALVAFCVFGAIAVIFTAVYVKNKQKYDLFTYFDAFPDMAAPLNVIALCWYKGRLTEKLEEQGLTIDVGGFSKMRQVCSLQLTAKTKNGTTLSVEFFTAEATVHNLDACCEKTVTYKKMFNKDDDEQQKLTKMIAFFASAADFEPDPEGDE